MSTEGSSKFSIVDIPGVEDFYWQEKIFNYLNEHKASVLPILLVDLT
jgi:hypothetical protein